MSVTETTTWRDICDTRDLVADSGVCAMVGDEQVALFYVPTQGAPIYAIQNYDPVGNANVLARGIVGDLDGKPVVASPLYKQHFCLATGECLEVPSVKVKTYEVKLDGSNVLIRA